MSDKYKVTGTNPNNINKLGVAQRQVASFAFIEGAERRRTELEAAGWNVTVEPPTRLVAPLDFEVGDVFYADDRQKWTVVEVLPVVNKGQVGATNVTATSNDLGHNQRGSFSFGNTRVEVLS